MFMKEKYKQKNIKRKGTSKKKPRGKKGETKRKEVRFSKSGWEWSLSF